MAKQVIQKCLTCRRLAAVTSQQLMADVPKEYIQATAPFTVVSLDLFGPFEVKGMGGHGRKRHKVWGVLYTCLSSKAVAVWTCPGYDARSFLETHARHTAIYGTPSIAISDHGSQLVAAAKQMAEWGVVVSATSSEGTQWKFTEKGCSWRNGLAERAIGMVKASLSHLVESISSLNVLHLETAFLKTAAIVNKRPIVIRMTGQDKYYAITPSDLLLGRATGKLRQTITETEWLAEREVGDIADGALGKMEAIVEAWWQNWIKRAFELLFPRRKWTRAFRNHEVDDIVLLKYDSKMSKHRYRLARVQEVYPDPHGRVRTVKIAVRDLRGTHAEPNNKCSTRRDTMLVGIQRLVTLLPREEQGPCPKTVATHE